MIDGVLYVTTPYNSMAALDAETGRELWRFDGEAYKLGQILSASGWKLRGTAFWRDGDKLRVFLNSRHRMFSLEAGDGRPVRSFGDAGVGLADRRPGAHLGHQARDAELAAGRLSRSGHRRQPGARSRAVARSDGLRPGVQRADRQAGLGLFRDSAVGEGSRRRDVGERIVAEERARERVGADGAGYGSRPAVSADLDADERLLWRREAGRQPVRGIAGLSRRRHGQDEVALPDGPSRALGLRCAGAAQSGHHHGQRPADRCGRADHQARVHLRLRPGDRTTGLADRRASGAGRQQRAGRETVSDAAVSHQTAGRSSIKASRSTTPTT